MGYIFAFFVVEEKVLWHTFACLFRLKTSIIVYTLAKHLSFSRQIDVLISLSLSRSRRRWCYAFIYRVTFGNFAWKDEVYLEQQLRAVIRLSKLDSKIEETNRSRTKEEGSERKIAWAKKANVISYALSCSLSPNLNIRVMPSFPFRQSFSFSLFLVPLVRTQAHTNSVPNILCVFGTQNL